MRIHPVVNVSRIVRYREPMKEQRVEKPKLVEVNRVKKQEVEKILNKREVRGVMKYLIRWKRFTVENDIWGKEEDLENAKEIIAEFGKRISTEVRRQKKLDLVEEQDYRREKLPGKYAANMLYGQNNGKFEKEYLKKLERNQ